MASGKTNSEVKEDLSAELTQQSSLIEQIQHKVSQLVTSSEGN